jgi:predicted ribosome quality control (RQC) complex YloA/Tae2 family protein
MLFVAPSGAEILVGRNAAQNDKLTRSAGTDDVWMHAEGPGAHVVLKASAGRVVDPRDLKYAADLAVYWSKARGTRTRVTVAGAGDVRTRKDGSATITKSKSVVGRPLASAPCRA